MTPVAKQYQFYREPTSANAYCAPEPEPQLLIFLHLSLQCPPEARAAVFSPILQIRKLRLTMEKCLTQISSKCWCWNFISSKFCTHLLYPYYVPCCQLANGALSVSDAGFALRTCSSGRRTGLPWITGLATPSDVLGLAAFDLALFRKFLRGRTRGLCVSGRARLLPLYTRLASLRPQLLATWAWGPEQRIILNMA